MTGRKKANLGDPKIDAAPDCASEQKAEALTKPRRRQNGKSLSPPYIPTDREREILSKQYERLNAEPPIPRLTAVREYDELVIVPDHPDREVGYALLQEAIGTDSRAFLGTMLMQLGYVCPLAEGVPSAQLDFMFSVVRGIRPRDQLEVMLAIQMAIVHWTIMSNYTNFARRVEHQDNVDGSLNKSTRTYAMLMETLKRYRTGGEQKVTVQHVSVNDGGQAIVANMTQDMREAVSKKIADKPLALTNSRQEPMPIVEEQQRERNLVRASRKQ